MDQSQYSPQSPSLWYCQMVYARRHIWTMEIDWLPIVGEQAMCMSILPILFNYLQFQIPQSALEKLSFRMHHGNRFPFIVLMPPTAQVLSRTSKTCVRLDWPLLQYSTVISAIKTSRMCVVYSYPFSSSSFISPMHSLKFSCLSIQPMVTAPSSPA